MAETENKFMYVDNPMDGPADGVTLETNGVHTMFKVKKRARQIGRQRKTPVRIMGSVELGVVSLTDCYGNQMITVPIADMIEILAEVLTISREKGGEGCRKENRGVDGAEPRSSGLEPGE